MILYGADLFRYNQGPGALNTIGACYGIITVLHSEGAPLPNFSTT